MSRLRRLAYWSVVTVTFLPFLVLEAASRLRERADWWFWHLQQWAYRDRRQVSRGEHDRPHR